MKLLFSLLFSVLSYSFSLATLSIEGTFQGKNLYVQNPMDDDGYGYCATEVSLNGTVIMDSIRLNVGAFEIDLISRNFAIGDSIFIVIKHHDGCKPKILLTGDGCMPLLRFFVTSIEISEQGILTWTTVNERVIWPYIVEQYRWNKWIPVGEVPGTGNADTNIYRFTVVPHSGENIFRITQSDYSGAKKTSNEIRFQSTTKKVKYKVNPEIKTIDFSNETLFELYDEHGSIIIKGSEKNVDCSSLKKGTYWLNFDNENVKIKLGVEKQKRKLFDL